MTSDEKMDTDIEPAEPTETSETNAAPETEVTDNTDWEEGPLSEEGDETPAETVAEPVAETQEDIEDGPRSLLPSSRSSILPRRDRSSRSTSALKQ